MSKKSKQASDKSPSDKSPIESYPGENSGAKTIHEAVIRNSEYLEGLQGKRPGDRGTVFSPTPTPGRTFRPDQRTPEQRIQEFMEWAESHPRDIPLLSEEAISRDSIY